MRKAWMRRIGALAALGWAHGAVAQVPAAPLLDAVRSGGDVVLSWPADPLATNGYRVERTDDLARPWIEIGQVATPGFVDLGAVTAPPPLLHYRVLGENGSGLGPPSNLAFRLNRPCAPDEWCAIPVPYRFWPNGSVGAPQTARELCQYLGPAVTQLRVTGELGGCFMPRNQACAIPLDRFMLAAGDIYLATANGVAWTAAIVGAHDPELLPGGPRSIPLPGCPSCAISTVLVAPPYHAAAGLASELCAELSAAGTSVASIAESTFLMLPRPGELVHFCGTSASDFALHPGNVYEVRVRAAGAWQPVVR